jgi:alanyl-tRNA synthetase
VITHLCPPENAADFPLRKTSPAGEDIIRVVEIAGNDFSPCCGTHVPSAGWIGMVRVLGAEKYKGMTRVTFIAGRRVLRDSRMLRQNGETISRVLKVPVAETGEAVLAFAGKTAALEKQVKELMTEAAYVRAAALVAEAGLSGTAGAGRVFGKLFPDTGMEELLTLGRAAQNLTGAALVFASGREAKFAAFSAAKDADLKSILKARMDEAGGRGGGNGGFFQGAFSSAGDLARFMESLPKP